MIRKQLSTDLHQITVGTTAKTIIEFIQDIDPTFEFVVGLNSCELNPDGGNIRYSICGVPSITKGMLLNSEQTRLIRGQSLDQVYLISTSGDVAVNIQIGYTEQT